MSLNIRVNTTPNVRTVVDTQSTKVNTRLREIDFSLVNLEELKNVDENVNGLEDGYTLVYDADQQRWITRAVTGITNIDGGTY
jgi:hypothetical protein